MFVRTPKMKFIRKKTFLIRPNLRPFLVDGRLNLHLKEKGKIVEVWIKIGLGAPRQLLFSGRALIQTACHTC